MDEYIESLVEAWDPEQMVRTFVEVDEYPYDLLTYRDDCGDAFTGPEDMLIEGSALRSSRETAWVTCLDDQATGSRVRAAWDYLTKAENRALYVHCAALAYWEYDKPLGHGRRVQRRGVCMQAAPGVPGYKYSGQMVMAHPLDDVLGPLLARLNADLGTDFNSWLLNRYRPRGVGGSNGDYLSPHSDDERTLAPARGGAVVAGITLTSIPGCVRILRFRRKNGQGFAVDLATTGGQLYVMEGTTQQYWTHEVPRQLSVPGERISLTARKFVIGHEAKPKAP